MVTTGGGSEERAFGSVRFGAKIGENAYYRIHGKYFNRGGLVDETGRGANDGQQSVRGGGRVDWQATGPRCADADRRHLSHHFAGNLVGDFAGRAACAARQHTPASSTAAVCWGDGRALFRRIPIWRCKCITTVSARNTFYLADHISTFDSDFQHHVALGQQHNLVWGLGYRLIAHQSEINSNNPVQFNPAAKTFQLFSGFAQDEITLVKDRLRLVLGAKLEHNAFSGFEAQPSARLSWTPSARQTVWAAVSRAVRTPSRTQQDLRANFQAFPAPDGTLNLVTAFGGPQAQSEVLRAYELGYRAQPVRRLSLDVAAFYNVYKRLTSFEPGLPFFRNQPAADAILSSRSTTPNLLRGETYGAEASVNFDINSRWKLQGSYSFLRMQLHLDPASRDPTPEEAEGDNPRHQFQLHSYFKLGAQL